MKSSIENSSPVRVLSVKLPAWRILWTGHLPLVLLYQAGPSSIPISPLEDEISPSSRSSRHPCCCPEAWWQTRWQTWWQTQPLLWWGELSPSTVSTTYPLFADHNQYLFFLAQLILSWTTSGATSVRWWLQTSASTEGPARSSYLRVST